jgi:hypothetical protein
MTHPRVATASRSYLWMGKSGAGIRLSRAVVYPLVV